MDKLTWYDNDGRIMCRRGYEVALARLASYEAAGLTPEQMLGGDEVKERLGEQAMSKFEERLMHEVDAIVKGWVSV